MNSSLNLGTIRELSLDEIEIVNGGGVDWSAVGAGAALLGAGLLVASTPVGWVGAAGATLLSFGGGWSMGSGVRENFYQILERNND